jgi:hypothetical protein
MNFHLAQDPAYHLFADNRMLLGIANAADTLSNLGFIVAGVLGLAFLVRKTQAGGSGRFIAAEERGAWWSLFAAIVLTGFGSAWYHLSPDDARLVWDRLPMSLGFAALVAATVSDRICTTWGARLLAPLLLLGAGSIAWWVLTGNLAPYAAMQFGSLATVLAIVIKFRSRYSHGHYMFGVLALYAAAKATESLDAWIYGFGGGVSGHTVKHLLAAAGVFGLLRMLQLRSPQ